MSVKSFFAAMTLKAKIIIVCTAVAVTSAAAVAVGVAVTKEDAYRVLKVFEMTGTAVVERDGSGALDAYVGMNLESGDTLTVADDSTLRISMDSDKYVLLDGGTILELVATGSPSDSRTSIDLKKGTILNEITNPLSANSSYEVSTPKATMAVRGTSFTVSVIDDDIGGYIIREDTFNGTVEVTLLDTDGKPKNDTALVPADKGVTIRTEPDEESGNPAEIDGFSRFVFENEEGIISDLGAGEDPIRDIRYDMVSATIKRNALRSNDENLMELDEEIVAKLRETSTTAAQTEKNTAAVSEPAPIASVSETAPVQTSVPEISAITEENTQTAAPSATIENQYSSPETSDVSLSVTEADLVSETAPTSVNSDTETVSEAVTAETTIETTAETTVETIAEELFESEPETVAASSETKVETSETVSNTTTRYETTVATFTTPDLIYNGSSNGSSPSVTTGASAAEKSVFEVEFMCDETLVSSVSVEEGKPVSNIPSIPEKNGYTGKWICDGKEFTSVTAVTSDITVNAVYTINTYAVTLTAAANDTYSNTVTADYGTLLSDILPEVPAKTGYTGVWKIGGTVDISSSVKVTSDLDIRAVYTANTYTVTFTAEADENYSSTVTADYGTPLAAILPEVPAKTGYTGEWKIGGTVNISSGITVTADLDIKAVYTINTYTITLTAAANETYSNTVTAVHGTLLTDILPEVPAKTGYTGVWKIKGTVDISSSVKVTSDLDIRAVYTANTYTVTFTADADETYSSTVTADHGTPLADILPEVPAKTGYTGVWKIGGIINISGGITVTSDLDIQAVYTINTYTVTFKAEGSEDIKKTAEHGKTVTEIPSVPEKTGYTGKWVIGEAEFTSSTVVTSDTIVTAEYKIITYTLTFTAEADENYSNTVTADYGTPLADILPEVPVKTNHTGVWKIGGTVNISGGITVTADLDIQAVYAINTYTVTFKAEGSEDITKTAVHGTTMTEIPSVPEKTGYTGKWVIGEAEFTSSTVVTSDTTVEAKYSPIAYTVSFSASEADDTSWSEPSRSINYDSKIGTLPEVPVKTGHDGVWTVDGAEIDADYIIKGITSVVAKYTKKNFTVTFTAAADTPYSNVVSAQYNTPIADILPTVPNKTGYDGVWKIDNVDIPSDYVITGNTEVKADYTPKAYAVNFSAQGADDPPNYSPTQKYYDSAIGTLPTVPEKTGHNGVWTVGGVEIDADYIIKGETNVVAKYTPIAYTLTLTSSEDLSYSETISADYGKLLVDVLPEAPEKTGYTVVWKIDGSQEVTESDKVTGDMAIQAVYTIITYRVDFYDTDGTTLISTRYLTSGDQISVWGSIGSETVYDYWIAYSEDGTKSSEVGEYEDIASLVEKFGFDENSIIKVVAAMNDRTITWYDLDGTSHSLSVKWGSNVIDELNAVYTSSTEFYWTDSEGAEIASTLICTDNITVYSVAKT